MAPSFMKKTMVYLGLLDDEYDEYDDLEDRAPRGFSAATTGRAPVARSHDQAEEFSGGMSRVRTIPRESASPEPAAQAGAEQRRPPPRAGAGRAGRHDHEPDGTAAVHRRPGCTWSPRRGSATPRRSPTASRTTGRSS